MSVTSLSTDELNQLKHAPRVEGVLPVFHQRWSPRVFTSREVTPAELAKVFEAARWAPSSGNQQPWRFLVGFLGSPTHDKLAAALMGFNKAWAGNAPVLILGVTNTINPGNGKPNGYALFDLGAASSYLVLQAAAQGLVAHQMAGYEHDQARQSLEIPESYALGSLIAVGYQGEIASIDNPQLVEKEIAPRTRKPLSEIVFSSWDTPADLS